MREMVSALRCGRPCDVRVTNYRKDGSTFANESIAPASRRRGERPAALLRRDAPRRLPRRATPAHAQRGAADEFLAALPPT